MKRILILIVMILSSDCHMSARDECAQSDAILVPVPREPGAALAWVKRGAAYRIVTAGSKCLGTIYRGADDRLTIISQGVVGIGEMIAAELGESEVAVFLDEKLPTVLRLLLGQRNSWVVNEWYLEAMRGLRTEGDLGYFDPEKVGPSLIILVKYCSPRKAEVSGGQWERAFFVVLEDGSIQRWKVSGRLTPFAILHFDRVEMEKAGSVMPLPTVGGLQRGPS
jgi:hypothetical protein